MQMVIRLNHLVVCSMWVSPFLKQSVFFRPKKGKYRSSDFFPRRRRRPFLRSRLLVSIFPATRKYTPHAESEARQHMAVQRSAVRPCIHVKPSWLSPTRTYLIRICLGWHLACFNRHVGAHRCELEMPTCQIRSEKKTAHNSSRRHV